MRHASFGVLLGGSLIDWLRRRDDPNGAAKAAPVAGPLLGLDGRLGLAGWQWLFLIEGAPAVLLGVIILFCLRDNPAEAPWLTEGERAWIQQQLSAEARAPGVPADQSFAQTLLDRRVWLLGLCNACILGASYAFGLSAPAVLKGATHWSATQVGLLMSGTALLGALFMVFNGAHSDRKNERYLHTIVPLALVASAFLAMGLSPTPEVVVTAYVLYYACYAAVQAAFWLIPSDSLRGRAAAGGLAAVGSIGMLGAFVGPFAWGLAKDHTGSYQLGLLSISCSFTAAALILLLIRRAARSAAEPAAEVVT